MAKWIASNIEKVNAQYRQATERLTSSSSSAAASNDRGGTWRVKRPWMTIVEIRRQFGAYLGSGVRCSLEDRFLQIALKIAPDLRGRLPEPTKKFPFVHSVLLTKNTLIFAWFLPKR
jgi:hypothetical protein